MKKKKTFKGLIALFILLVGVIGLFLGLKVKAENEAGKITVSNSYWITIILGITLVTSI